MADNDSTRGRGRGNGRGISRGRGRVRGRGTTTLPQPFVLQPTHHSTGQSTHPSTSHTHVAPQPPRSTPSPHPSFTNMLHSSTNPSTPSTHPADDASGDDPRVSLSSHVDSSPQIGTRDTDGRMWIRPGPGNTFDPPIQPTREIARIIKTKFEGCWETYGEVKSKDKQLKKLWWGEFQRKFKWLPEHKARIKKTYHHKASDGYSNAMYRVRRKIDSGSWIPAEMREKLEQKWNTDDWKGKAIVNTNNRSLSDGSLHTGGSIPTTEHYKRMKKSSDLTPSCWDLFQKTHKIKGDAVKWVSSKSESIANEYERCILERDSQEAIGDDVSSHQSDNNIFLDVVGGVDKKGRIYGLGAEAAKYKPSSSTSSIGISPSEYEEMKTQVSNLTAENKALKDKLDMLAATQEQMRQFMESFSLTHPSPLVPPSPPPPPPPPRAPTNEDDQQGDDELYHELGADV